MRPLRANHAFSLAAIVAASLLARDASAQRLTVAGDRFAVDGSPRFLTFISYFGAMGAQDVAADLRFLKESGFDGVRIWPNSPEGPQLMRADGSLDQSNLRRLLEILDRARDGRLIVDVTFTGEHIGGLTPAVYRTAIAAATRELLPYRNLVIDIENERNIHGPLDRALAASDVAATAAAIKAIDPERVVTASNSQDLPAASAAQFTTDTGLDVTAYHDPRIPSWYQAGQVQNVVDTLRRSGKPVYLQEPTRFPNPSTDRAEFFRTAHANAKRAGAAAWCFHTDLGFNLRGTTFRAKLQTRLEPEWTFVTTLMPRVHLRASNGIHYVAAEGGGGAAVFADRRLPGLWETFALAAVDGGPPLDHDRVSFRTSDGRHYLQAGDGGGGTMNAKGEEAGLWETFIVDSGRGDAIAAGQSVTIRTAGDPSWYVVAVNGGGGAVMVNQRSPANAQAFTIAAALPADQASPLAALGRSTRETPPRPGSPPRPPSSVGRARRRRRAATTADA
jgi:hypothetical protein